MKLRAVPHLVTVATEPAGLGHVYVGQLVTVALAFV
jgi:hypothetical protein